MTPHAHPAPTADDAAASERIALNLLILVADHPGRFGRLRASRIVGGFSIAQTEEPGTQAPDWSRYAVSASWPLRELVDLTDALIAGGLITQTIGQRPTLCITRPGWRALDALEGGS